MIDLKLTLSGEGSPTRIDIKSSLLSIDTSVEKNNYTLYNSDGVKILTISFGLAYPSGIYAGVAITLNYYGFDDVVLTINSYEIFSVVGNVSESNYSIKNGTFLGTLSANSATTLDISNYYKIAQNNGSFDITYFVGGVVDSTYSLDCTNPYDGFFNDIYLNSDGSSILTLEFLTPAPFYFDFLSASMDLSFSYSINGVNFDTFANKFSSVRTVIESNDNLSLTFASLGDSPYYISTVSSATGSGGTSTILPTSLVNDIKTQIDTSINDYFTNNPIDVSNVSITSVVDDVTSALNSFFVNGAYLDMTTTNNTLDSIVNNVSNLSTLVSSLSSSSGGTIDLTDIFTRFDNVDNAISSIPTASIDFTDLLTRFDTVDTNIANVSTTTVDCSTIDLSSMETAIIDTISANTHQFITNSSLNGSNGAIYEDGKVLNVDGYTRTYTVVSSQVITTMGNQADYIYLLKDSSDRFMITVQDMLSRPETA